MKSLIFLLTPFLAFALLTSSGSAQDTRKKMIAKGKLVRMMRNADGSTTEFKRDLKNTQMITTTYVEKANGEKIIRSRTVYRRDKNGRLRSGKIEDGKRNLLYKILYGYHKVTGRLIAENMYDARAPRHNNPNTPKKETPIRAVRYMYNAQGERSKPIIFTAPAGKTAAELKAWLKKNKYEKRGVGPAIDPFRESGR